MAVFRNVRAKDGADHSATWMCLSGSEHGQLAAGSKPTVPARKQDAMPECCGTIAVIWFFNRNSEAYGSVYL
ncbi:hypothetical protein CWE13_04715 [Aliidiomarina shirensis]|uniref:Uncharacterized protein n=1 Tax=Aliidiomarina shirensis TaxID=1048642 RepID=A0A432WU10_9GAMM|nr:hypothetical protein CWE13_04715 [Aliidiomarina shirensis]